MIGLAAERMRVKVAHHTNFKGETSTHDRKQLETARDTVRQAIQAPSTLCQRQLNTPPKRESSECRDERRCHKEATQKRERHRFTQGNNTLQHTWLAWQSYDAFQTDCNLLPSKTIAFARSKTIPSPEKHTVTASKSKVVSILYMYTVNMCMYIYIYPPTPALAKAGAAPGTTEGVEPSLLSRAAPKPRTC